MQTDPIGYADGMNWYNYVGSDAINFSDPMGLGEICNADGSQCQDDGVKEILVVAGQWDWGWIFGPPQLDWGFLGFGHDGGGSGPTYADQPCPSSGAVTVGLSGDYYAPGGGSVEGGLAVDVGSGQAELFGSAAGGAGVDIGGGLAIGYYPSGLSALEGNFAEFDVNVWVADISIIFGKGGEHIGSKITFGPQLPGVPLPGGHASVGRGTSTFDGKISCRTN